MTASAKKCPICRKTAGRRFAPFCSTRCADEDLARWMGGAYRITATPEPDKKADADEDPDDEKTPGSRGSA